MIKTRLSALMKILSFYSNCHKEVREKFIVISCSKISSGISKSFSISQKKVKIRTMSKTKFFIVSTLGAIISIRIS